MRHQDIEVGVDYAAQTSYGRPDMQRPGMTRVRVVDARREWVRDGGGGYCLLPDRGAPHGPRLRYRESPPGMLAEWLDSDSGKVGGRLLLQPRQVGGTWADYVAEQGHVREVGEREARRAARAERERDALDGRLRAHGIKVSRWGGQEVWTLYRTDVEALLALLDRAGATR